MPPLVLVVGAQWTARDDRAHKEQREEAPVLPRTPSAESCRCSIFLEELKSGVFSLDVPGLTVESFLTDETTPVWKLT